MPSGISPFTAQFDGTEEGVFLIASSIAEGPSQECVVIRSDEETTRVFRYRHEFYPTRCLHVAHDGEGGFVLRGERSDLDPEAVGGFTVRVDAEGELRWVLEDAVVLDEGFSGNYRGALPGLAVDFSGARAMAMSLGGRPLAGSELPVTQLHRIETSTGALLRGGITFGPQFNDLILDVVPREGHFLIHALDGRNDETIFYELRSENRIQRVQPAGQSWTSRDVLDAPLYLPEVGTLFLYRQGNRFYLSRIEGDQSRWDLELPVTESLLVEERPIGTARKLWATESAIVVGYENAQRERSFFFVDPETGEPLGAMNRRGFRDREILSLGRGPEGSLRGLVFDVDALRFFEVVLHLNEVSLEDGNEEERENEASGDEENGGCSTLSSSGAPSPLLLLAIGLFVALKRGSRALVCGS